MGSLRRWVIATLLLATGCGAGPGAKTVRVIVTDGSARLVVRAEVAATPEERAVGLMNRPAVPAGTGMLFVFPGPTSGGFWMKDTLVDLHILFIDGSRVVEIRNMRPCTADPCPVTKPARSYDKALEVPIGTLGGVESGATVEIFGPIPEPR